MPLHLQLPHLIKLEDLPRNPHLFGRSRQPLSQELFLSSVLRMRMLESLRGGRSSCRGPSNALLVKPPLVKPPLVKKPPLVNLNQLLLLNPPSLSWFNPPRKGLLLA